MHLYGGGMLNYQIKRQVLAILFLMKPLGIYEYAALGISLE